MWWAWRHGRCAKEAGPTCLQCLLRVVALLLKLLAYLQEAPDDVLRGLRRLGPEKFFLEGARLETDASPPCLPGHCAAHQRQGETAGGRGAAPY